MEDANAAYSRQDYITAERMLRPLAEQGRAGAQHLLARMYENGQGVPRSNVEAAKWYRLAADRGHAGAQLYLANLYSVGDGVPIDYVQAYMWFSLSEAAGQGEFASHGRRQIADKMTAAQIAEANRRVRAWRPAAGN
jgi:TPR repeat protein